MLKFYDIKLSQKGKLYVFFILIFLHFLIIFFLLVHPIFYIILFFEILIFLSRNRRSLFLTIRIFLITLFIFFSNLLFYDGKIIFSFYFFNITREGLYSALQRSFLFLMLFLFTSNSFYSNRSFFISIFKKKSFGLFYDSINYFFQFINLINVKKGKEYIFKSIYRLYHLKEDKKNIQFETDSKNALEARNFNYHIVALAIFFALLVIFLVKVWIIV